MKKFYFIWSIAFYIGIIYSNESPCVKINSILSKFKTFKEFTGISYLSASSTISFYRENITTNETDRYTITPIVSTKGGNRDLLKFLWWEENPTIIDTLLPIDLNHNGQNELVLILSRIGYLREFSTVGKVIQVFAFSDKENLVQNDSCIIEKYPFITEYFSLIRTAVVNDKDSCFEKFCTKQQIIKEIHRLASLTEFQYLLEAHKLALKSYKSKSYSDAASISSLALMDMAHLSDSTVNMLNDMGFFKAEAKEYDQALQILKPIADNYPNRTVVFLNLGDAYYGLKNTANAKEAYMKYVELMRKDGKEKKIPQRVLDYLNK